MPPTPTTLGVSDGTPVLVALTVPLLDTDEEDTGVRVSEPMDEMLDDPVEDKEADTELVADKVKRERVAVTLAPLDRLAFVELEIDADAETLIEPDDEVVTRALPVTAPTVRVATKTEGVKNAD